MDSELSNESSYWCNKVEYTHSFPFHPFYYPHLKSSSNFKWESGMYKFSLSQPKFTNQISYPHAYIYLVSWTIYFASSHVNFDKAINGLANFWLVITERESNVQQIFFFSWSSDYCFDHLSRILNLLKTSSLAWLELHWKLMLELLFASYCAECTIGRTWV